jgi:hypothetical protein
VLHCTPHFSNRYVNRQVDSYILLIVFEKDPYGLCHIKYGP